ncbi:glycoside hydrolase family 88 protein [Didymella exigua CBS 183.55]|uniref:Glycoside hydrolase family 88 protein n=1 Tax=Didymella exigua CBS 183.55 TaxID=1150837 RepID=A0A6A5R695_9PLEO|nr:glycoside hydrolase family 88 protein [Didymella exigua CBS 183.55]KAF1922534.1 glycoside hydrolase family 88 protein [Didymella exigua CBS 183.55]
MDSTIFPGPPTVVQHVVQSHTSHDKKHVLLKRETIELTQLSSNLTLASNLSDKPLPVSRNFEKNLNRQTTEADGEIEVEPSHPRSDAPEDLKDARNDASQERTSVSSTSDEEEEDADTTSPLTSTPPSECGVTEPSTEIFALSASAPTIVPELYAENIIAKAFRTAQTALGTLPFAFPEIVSQDTGADGTYTLREADFWTCGFFPGTLYLLLERLIRFPQSLRLKDRDIRLQDLRSQLATLCRAWSEPIRGMDTRKDTHDIGFIIMPALRLDWELFNNTQSLDSIVRAAHSLATRYVPSAQAIRSWDLLKKKDIEILDQTENMIVIIDSMCNLDLLYYASHHAQEPGLAEVATAHALTLLGSHLRLEPVLSSSNDAYNGQWYSTCHVSIIDPRTGELKRRLSAQGYAHESTWARGQGWGILGYAETYTWTKDRRFLEASCGLAEYFLHRMEVAPACVGRRGRYVPLWDFDAPIENEENPLRDSSAGVIAANGMLILSQALAMIGQPRLSLRYRDASLRIVRDTLDFALAPEKARLAPAPYGHIRAEDELSGVRFDGMLKFGTANYNAQARKRYANHGLVYGDYYLVEFGNRLLRMGLY